MHPKCDVINLPAAGRRSSRRLSWFEIRFDDRPRLCTRDDGHDFERHPAVAPLKNPALDEPQIVAAHQLEAAGKVGLDPAVDIVEPLRQRSARLTEALIDRDHIVVAEVLDDHEQHNALP